MEWFSDNWPALLAIAGLVIALAEAVVRLTPTPEDDKVVSKIRRVYEKLTGRSNV
jgi:hypothetical protein